jgi:BASS family bile acid:Na+ symporter
MSEIMQFLEATFKLFVLVFTVLNLATMGLQARMPEVVAVFKNKKVLALIFVWGWVLGPALGLLIAWVFPLAEPYVICVLIASLASCGPFLPPMVEKARGDTNFAGAFIPLVAAGTVVFMPLMAPLLIKGVTINAGALAKPLFVTLLVPLMIGAATRHYAETVATKIFPAVRGFAKLSTLLVVVASFVLYGHAMLDTAGSFALLAATVFMVAKGLITYQFGFGLKQNQRSVMSLGMLTPNGAAMFVAILAIPDADPRILTLAVMWTVWSIALAAIAARIFAKQAGETVAGHAPKGEADI